MGAHGFTAWRGGGFLCPWSAESVGLVWGVGIFRLARLCRCHGIPQSVAVLAALAEFFGGLGLILGFLTRIFAFGIFCVMTVAILEVHLKDGFFMNWFLTQDKGHGIEYSLTLLLAAASLMLPEAAGWVWIN